MYGTPDMDDPIDSLAHALSEIMNDAAPIGWSNYRGAARCLLANFDIGAKPGSATFDTHKAALPPLTQQEVK